MRQLFSNFKYSLLFIVCFLISCNSAFSQSKAASEYFNKVWEVVNESLKHPKAEYVSLGRVQQQSRRYSHYAGALLDSAHTVSDTTTLYAEMLEESMEYLRTSLKLDSSNISALVLSGNLYYYLRSDPHRALDYYHKALKIDSSYYAAIFNVMSINHEEENYSESVKYIPALLKSELRSIRDIQFVGELYYKIDSFELAEHYLHFALEHDSSNAPASFYLGLIHGKIRHQLDSAIIYLTNALTFHEEPPVSYYEDLGVAYGFQGNYKRALEVLREGLKHYPEKAGLHHNLYVTYDKLGNDEKADYHKQQSISLREKE